MKLKEFKQLAQQYNLIPVVKEIPGDLDTPISAFLKLREGDHNFLFESVVGGEDWARYSFLGTKPIKHYSYQNEQLHIQDLVENKSSTELGDPFQTLRSHMQQYNCYQHPQLPRFFGGWVGYFGHEMVTTFEDLKLKHKEVSVPAFQLFQTDCVVIFDNVKKKMLLVCTVFLKEGADIDAQYELALSKLTDLESRLQNTAPQNPQPLVSQKDLECSMTEEQYCQMVDQAKEYILSGDIFQVVLSLRFQKEFEQADPISIYRAIRRINPSPYMYYVSFGDLVIVGASPEVMVRVEKGEVHVRPIAGTRKRGATDADDQRLEQELLNDPKEKAEHVMLVDLGRNDLGRIAKKGTVQVDENEVIERYSHVMHLVSHVSAELSPEHDVLDAIKATFPAGTLSGAPKIRALQIIDELEVSPRGVYGGAIGYIGFNQNADMAIAIRTAVVQKNKVTVQAGAGIVFDSIPQNEYKECCHKARAVMEAIQ